MQVAGLIDVLEKLLSGEISALSDDARQPLISETDRMSLSRLAAETKTNRRSLDLGMLILKGCQTEGAVRPGVFLIADADMCGFQQPHDRGQDFRAR